MYDTAGKTDGPHPHSDGRHLGPAGRYVRVGGAGHLAGAKIQLGVTGIGLHHRPGAGYGHG